MSDNKKNLYYLDELPDYQVAHNYCDVRGWDVLDVDDRTIGKVDRLLVNLAAERVVYLDVEVDKTIIEEGHKTYEVPANAGVHEFLNKDGEDHIIIPIGMANLDEENNKVQTNQINFQTFAKAKRFQKNTDIDHDYELVLFRHFLGHDKMDLSAFDERFYNRKEFENYWRRKETLELM